MKKQKTILGKKEPKPFQIKRPKAGKAPAAHTVIVCDHASNKVPASLRNLGLTKAERQKHIAWDPGTKDIGLYLSKKLGAPVVQAQYSRLVVDLNRGHTNKECMRDVSDGIKVPGNKGLTAAQRKQRLNEIFWPYHDAIDAELARFTKKKIVPVLMSIHSFTPAMKGEKRPWHIGVLWNKEEDIAGRIIKNLRKNKGLIVGENEPYSLKGHGLGKDTVQRHADSKGYPYIIVEFRQDLVNTKAKAEKFAKIFLAAILPVLADKSVHQLRQKR